MLSDLQSTLEFYQLIGHITLAVAIAVTYDYLLTFSSEIDYVWRRPWTLVSTTFILVRYGGLSWVIIDHLAVGGSMHIPGTQTVCTVLNLVNVYTFQVFINAADLMMILRVYAICNRAKTVIRALLLVYLPETIFSFVFAGVYYNPNTHISAVVQVNDLFFCELSLGNQSFFRGLCIILPRLALGSALLVLAVIQTLKQSVDMYKTTKQWKPNRYMQLLVKDGILYFLVMALFNVTILIQASGAGNGSLMIYLSRLASIAMCTLTPRFIISIRELYDRDLHGRWQGTDSGFGVLSQLMASQPATVPAIDIADATQREVGESEGIQLERRGGDIGQV